MTVADCAGAMIAPGAAPVVTAHYGAGFHAGDDYPRVAGRDSNALHGRRQARFGWRAPPAARRDAAESIELPPGRGIIARFKQHWRLRARINDTGLGATNGNSTHSVTGKPYGLPRPAPVGGTQHTLS